MSGTYTTPSATTTRLPLTGRRLAVTRPVDQAGELADGIRSLDQGAALGDDALVIS